MSFPASPPRDQQTGQAPALRQPRTEPLPSDPAELEKIIRGQQERLAEDVDALADLVAPKNVVARTKADLRARVERAKADLRTRGRGAVYGADGQPRTDRLAAAGAGLAGLLALLVLRGVRKRRRNHPRHEIEKAAARGQKRASRQAKARRRGDDS